MKRITAFVGRGSVAILVCGVLIVAFSCQRSDDGPSETGLVLRSYQVPDETAPEMERIINNVLHVEGVSYGRAVEGPGGQVIVAAPESVHSGVEELIKGIRGSRPAPPPTITCTYWAVIGTPAPETVVGPGLGEVESTLEAIASAEGARSFTLLEKIRLHSLSGEGGETRGQQLRTEQVATARDGRVLANLRIAMNYGSGYLETKVNVEPDQLLVLGQTGLQNRPGERKHSATNIYFVVRAQVQAGS